VKLEQLERKTFHRDGLALTWFDAGGEGLPVVFQHGLLGDANQTAEVFPDDRRLRLITLECRGHGNSEDGPSAGFAIAAFTDDVAALLDQQGLPRAVIGGISMGAAIASRLAVKRPDLTRALVLARPAWVTESAPPNMQPNAEIGRLLAGYPAAAARALFEQRPTARRLAEAAPDNLASLLRFFDRRPADTTAQLLMAISADGPGITESDLAGLSVPTLVIGHERDAVHPIGHAETLARLIPAARMAVITPKATDKAAHIEQFRHALQSFLEVA
jgi:pimeloyl-ACP methyl ester carboxylesterase